MRPANVVTSVADVWAGAAVAYGLLGLFVGQDAFTWPLVWLSLSTACLYGGGVVLNDFFDASLDAVERPERPIPRGAVGRGEAGVLGFSLLAAGVLLALGAGLLSGALALLIALLVLLYDTRAKHHPLWGPLNMGLCRAVNLLLGLSLIPELTLRMAWLGVFPVLFIAAVTVISRGEVFGGDRHTLQISFVLYLLLLAGLLALGFWQGRILPALVFALCWCWMAASPVLKAQKSLQPGDIRKAVKSGVISLIFLDAAYAAVFAGWLPALIIAALLPLSLWLARLFAVT